MRSSVKKSLLLVTTLGVAAGFVSSARATAPYSGSRFADVWGQLASDRYAALPHQAVTFASFFGVFEDKLLDASRRTLSDKSDLLPRFQKLLHPNGICLAGTWNITEDTGYTGYYKKGSQGLFIARASTALTATEQGDYRAFGFAGKLFPTMDPNAQVATANFVTIEDLGGTLRDNFLDAPNTNDIIHISITSTVLWNTGVGAAAVKAFATADNTLDVTQTLIRQLYPISELGEPAGTVGHAPTWMQIVGAPDVVRVDARDFRDELRVQNFPGGLRFAIRTADVGTRLGDKQWKTIGYIEATEDAVSDSCDHRLHFAHPQFRK